MSIGQQSGAKGRSSQGLMKIRLNSVQEESLAFSVNTFSALWLRVVNIHRFMNLQS